MYARLYPCASEEMLDHMVAVLMSPSEVLVIVVIAVVLALVVVRKRRR